MLISRESLARSGMSEGLKYNLEQRLEYLAMIDRVGGGWLEVFQGNTEFYSAAYWDLLTEIWRHSEPVRKTDALRFMKAVKSPHTAGKYIGSAIRYGIVLEEDNPEDARSKLLRLSDDMRGRLDRFFDRCVGEVRKANRSVEAKGPVPKAP